MTAGIYAGTAIIGLIAFGPLLSVSDYWSPIGFLAIVPILWCSLSPRPARYRAW